jgi:hypothetical protein
MPPGYLQPGTTGPIFPDAAFASGSGAAPQPRIAGRASAAFGSPGYSQATQSWMKQNTPAPAPAPSPMQTPGNNLVNPGYAEQAFEYTQNRLLEDPYSGQLGAAYDNTQTASKGENYLNQNLGSLNGPGQGEQYWNQVQGQYQDPFAGEQFARQATQNFQAQGPASAFNQQAQGDHYDAYTNYSTGNAQGQYGQSAGQLAGGTQGEQGLGQIAGDYGSKGTYNGQNNAQGQYQQNAASGPLAAQQFYDQVGGSYGELGQYQDPNRAAGQYEQTQQAFGDLPIANFDPFYDRAIQLGTQDYNRQSAGRGVYGSSEALSGVGNIITDLNAQRANRSFDAEMQRAQEQRARQELLGNQARQGDLSGLGAFAANQQGLQTFGNLANQAGNQTLNQQTMLGNQARDADVSATDAFGANLAGASTFANINNMQANQELGRHELLGSMANSADTQATSAQNARTNAMSAFGDIASSADNAETNRYQASTNAMNQADQTGLDRMNSGAEIAFKGDDSRRQDYETSSRVAESAARLGMDRNLQGANISNTQSQNDLNRLDSFNSTANTAENSRQNRQMAKIQEVSNMSRDMSNMVGNALDALKKGDQAGFEQQWEAEMVPKLQAAGKSEQEIAALKSDLMGLVPLAV